VEARLGAGALDGTRTPPRRGWRVSLSPGARGVVKAAHRRKTARGDRDFAAKHLLFGLVAQPGPFADAPGARGVTTASVLAAMDGDGP
jgi:hypothetical protein